MPCWADAAAVLAGAERWLLPPECLLCRRPVGEPGDPLICSLCRTRWARLPEPVCDRCGQPRDRDLECRLCAEWPARFGPLRSAVWLTGGARAAVHQLKYGGWWRTGEAMASVMTDLLPPDATLVPVPLGRKRLRERGYNQSEMLARALGCMTGLRVRNDLLRRARETRRQTELAPQAREANVAGAFLATERLEAPIVLIDDVFTTGATLLAAARPLLAAGVPAVSGATFARARRPLDDDVSDLTTT